MKGTLHLPKDEPIIREASHSKVDLMVEYGRKFWDQTRYAAQGIEYDIETVTSVTHSLINEGVALYADDKEGNIVALMLVLISPFPMNAHHLAACEWVFYVEPEYRRGGLGAKLMAAAEKALRVKRVKYFTMVSLTNVTPEAAHALYESLGFEQSETNFTKDLG